MFKLFAAVGLVAVVIVLRSCAAPVQAIDADYDMSQIRCVSCQSQVRQPCDPQSILSSPGAIALTNSVVAERAAPHCEDVPGAVCGSANANLSYLLRRPRYLRNDIRASDHQRVTGHYITLNEGSPYLLWMNRREGRASNLEVEQACELDATSSAILGL